VGSLGAVTARDYQGADDLRRMQRLVQDAWALRGPKWAQHVGDLAWARFQHVGREPGWQTMLWEEDGGVVAYGWLFEGGVLDFCVHPERRELLEEVLDWAQPRETDALDANIDAIAVLERRRFVRAAEAPFMAYLERNLDALPAAVAPDGFELRTVEEGDVESRVEAHRSAFHPSRVTVESYRNVMETWPYRGDLDAIAVAPDGRVAAYCLAWLDDENRVGELEPVGTHAEFRRRGLASAVCAFALQRLSAEGAIRAVVYARGDEEYPAPKRLYESLGFRAHARTVPYVATAV
jgi:ribosomal protein S18 acetylase RimI-like enzyme